MKTLRLAIITILVIVISIASNVYAQSSSTVSASLAKVSVGLFNITETSPTIVISGIVYKAFSQNIVLTIFNPQNQLISVSQLQPRLDGTFSQSIIPSNPLWPKGNYTVRMTSGSQNLTESVFYFPGIGCCKRIIIPGVQGQINNSTNPLSPLKQFKSGIPASEVTCKQGFQLISKREDGSPACVTSSTAIVLESHGWAMNQKSTIMHVELDQSHYPPNNLDYYFVKGMIYTANGPVQNSTVSIFGNNIPLGDAMTDPTGCFQFDSWNNTEINQQMSNASNSHQESYTLKITSAYVGDRTHDAVNDTKSAIVYFQLFPIPPPFYVSSTNPPTIQVKQGDSASLKLSVTHLTGGPVEPMELTVQRLPCGITYVVPSNAASNNGTFNISIATQDYTRVGKYYLDVIQDTSHFENPNIISDPYIGMISLEVLPK